MCCWGVWIWKKQTNDLCVDGPYWYHGTQHYIYVILWWVFVNGLGCGVGDWVVFCTRTSRHTIHMKYEGWVSLSSDVSKFELIKTCSNNFKGRWNEETTLGYPHGISSGTSWFYFSRAPNKIPTKNNHQIYIYISY